MSRRDPPVNCRACVLTALSLTGPASTTTVAERAGFTVRRVRDVLRALGADGLVTQRRDGLWRLRTPSEAP